MKKLLLTGLVLGLFACHYTISTPTTPPIDSAISHVKLALDTQCQDTIRNHTITFFQSWTNCDIDKYEPGWIVDDKEVHDFQRWINNSKLDPAIKDAYQHELDWVVSVSDNTKQYGCTLKPHDEAKEQECGAYIPVPAHNN